MSSKKILDFTISIKTIIDATVIETLSYQFRPIARKGKSAKIIYNSIIVPSKSFWPLQYQF